MLLLLLACTADPTDSDSQGTDDTSSSSGVQCPEHAGITAGETRSYDTKPDVQQEKGYRFWYTQTVEPLEEDADGNLLVTVTQQSWQTGGGYQDYTLDMTLNYRCDDQGIWYTGNRRDWTGTLNNGTEDTGWQEASFEGYLLLPAEQTGAPWNADWSATFIDHTDREVRDARLYTFTPSDPETVTTDAGSFEATRVDGTQDTAPIGTWWYAAGEGLVQTLDVQRVSGFE